MMRLFLIGTALLTLSFVVHVVAWRVFIPRLQIRALLSLFVVVPVLAIVIGAIGAWSAQAGISASDVFRILLFYIACSLVYVCIYSAVEVQSPTIAIVLYVASRGKAGCSKRELASRMMKDDDIGVRISLMKTGGLIAIGKGLCQLSPKGRFFAKLFESTSGVFGLPPGG